MGQEACHRASCSHSTQFLNTLISCYKKNDNARPRPQAHNSLALPLPECRAERQRGAAPLRQIPSLPSTQERLGEDRRGAGEAHDLAIRHLCSPRLVFIGRHDGARIQQPRPRAADAGMYHAPFLHGSTAMGLINRFLLASIHLVKGRLAGNLFAEGGRGRGMWSFLEERLDFRLAGAL